MTVYHVFYIPAVLFIGVFLGAIVGRRQLMTELAEKERAERERKHRRAERERKRAARTKAAGDGEDSVDAGDSGEADTGSSAS